jgi:UDP-glucose 4-epimerase
MKSEDVNSVLIIGMSGGLAQITAGLVAKKYPHAIITGVDSRPLEEPKTCKNLVFKKMNFTRGNFEKLFRDNRFDVVFHLARMSHSQTSALSNLSQRLDLNLMGTKRILDLSLKHEVKKVVILSTFHVYGALADNPVFIKEDSPLKASIKYPELRDVVEMDQIATNWLWRYQGDIETIVLRPCNIIGPEIRNTMTQYLVTPYVPICMDFNPMFQFIHEYDMAHVLCSSLEKLPMGIYNVAPDECISIKKAKSFLEMSTLPVPSLVLEGGIRLVSSAIWNFPRYLTDYIKFSCILDNSLLKSHLGEDFCSYTTRDTLELCKME